MSERDGVACCISLRDARTTRVIIKRMRLVHRPPRARLPEPFPFRVSLAPFAARLSCLTTVSEVAGRSSGPTIRRKRN